MRRIGPVFWPLLIIAVGIVFLLSKLNVLPFNPWELVKLWPLILVVIGLDILLGSMWRRGRHAAETLSIDRDTLTEADVSLEFGAGELNVSASDAPGKLIEGKFTDDVECRLRGGRVRVYSRPEFWYS